METMKKHFEETCPGFYTDLSVYQNKQINCVWCRKDRSPVEKDRVFIPSVPLTVKNFLRFTLNHTEGLPEVDLSGAIKIMSRGVPQAIESVVPNDDIKEVKHILSILPGEVANNLDQSMKV